MTEMQMEKLEADYDLASADVSMERAKAIVTLIVVCAVNVANVLGYTMDADAWVNVALSILSAASIVYAWWKNQNITGEAAQAQVLLDALKMESKAAKHAKKAA